MQPIEYRPRDDIPTYIAQDSRRRRTGCALAHRPVRTPVVEIGNILGQGLSQVALVEDEYLIQTLGSDRPYPPLGDRVGARRSEWGPDLRDAEIVPPPIENFPVATVTVMDEKARWFAIPAAAFDDLLRHPLCRGTASHLDMKDLAVGLTDHEEDIESPERDRLHAEEVTGPQVPGMWVSAPLKLFGSGWA
jgi:hypothetical protein